jgi:hypothetical protein
VSDRKIWDIAGGTGESTGLKIEMLQNGAKQGKAKLSAMDFQWLFDQVYPDFLSDT